MSSSANHKNVNPQHVRAVLRAFFNPAFAAKIKINDKVVGIVWEMVSSSQECTKVFNLVPKPPGFRPGSSYLASQFAAIAHRLLTQEDSSVSNTCKAASSYRYSNRIQMASMGL